MLFKDRRPWHIAGALAALLIGASGMATRGLAADLMVRPAPAGVAQLTSPKSAVFWTGLALAPGTLGGDIGAVWAFSGNMDATGFQLRGQGVYDSYQLLNAGNGQFERGNVSVGYQWSGSFFASAFVGVDLQHRDATSTLRDTTGLFVAGRLASATAAPIPWSLEGDYSTANGTYWTRGRIGYRTGSLHFGPEVLALGDKGYSASRIGGYVATWSGSWGVEVDAGYQNGSGGPVSGGNGAYGGAALIFAY